MCNSTVGFGSIKSYTNCRTFQKEPSRTPPRKTVSLITCSILCSFTLICIGKWYFFCLGLNNIKFVFFRFKESLLALNQADNLLSSELLKSRTTRAIFIWSGTMPRVIDKLIIWAKGSAIIWIDCFMMEMGILSWPADFPDRKELEIFDSSFGFTGLKNTDWQKWPGRKLQWETDEWISLARSNTRKITTESIGDVYWIRNFLVVNFTYGIDFRRFLVFLNNFI